MSIMSPFTHNPETLLGYNPLALANYFRSQIQVSLPSSIDTKEEKQQLVQTMNLLTSYICYFSEMEMLSRIAKRKAKHDGCSQEESDRVMGVEEVFGTYKKIVEQLHEQGSKMMTMKRLDLEETKLMGTQT